jgi:hypothetical protein
MNDTITPYVQIEDSNGAVASVYFMDDQKHEVQYKDKSGKRFFTELFEMVPIEIVEKMAMEWATGKRELSA